MTARDELIEILHQTATADRVKNGALSRTPVVEAKVHETADAILAAGYSKPRTITTAEEIRELPALTMVVFDDMANGGPLEAYVVPDDGTVMFKDRYPFHLLRMNGDYVDSEAMPLPLTVVYEVGR